jgi:hypothetical protein
MLALLIAVICAVALLTVLVAGLLRSHADILRALHSLGAGVGDPARRADGDEHQDRPRTAATSMATYGAPLAGERSTKAHDLIGVTPEGTAIALAVNGPGRLTLLAFLSSGCVSCRRFFDELADPKGVGLPSRVRVVAVTKGPEHESAPEVAALAGRRMTTVMSSDAWSDYEVPGSPFFALVDGDAQRRIGEGVGGAPAQVADLVRRALADREALGRTGSARNGSGSGSEAVIGLSGPAREADNDRRLIQVGVLPGDASLYPSTLADIFATSEREASAG